MIITHHPTDETLAAFAGANLDEGNTLVVAAHLQLCARCTRAVRQFQDLACVLIEDEQSMALSPGARSRVLDTISHCEQPAWSTTARPHARDKATCSPLSLYENGKWRWLGVGVQWKPISVNSEAGTRVFLLKAAPGTRLPDHRHVGTEWTCVLEGAFTHHLGRFGPGDFDEADDTVEHDPFVEREGECICLVALNGHIELRSWLGRLIQPLVRI